mmetsp:Transcript_14388/g.30563  ORF Transcript_14388/g.30563 Transcript_14388/m.30563 type:complete len:207 (+) Transcript_14388:45-665(+)
MLSPVPYDTRNRSVSFSSCCFYTPSPEYSFVIAQSFVPLWPRVSLWLLVLYIRWVVRNAVAITDDFCSSCSCIGFVGFRDLVENDQGPPGSLGNRVRLVPNGAIDKGNVSRSGIVVNFARTKFRSPASELRFWLRIFFGSSCMVVIVGIAVAAPCCRLFGFGSVLVLGFLFFFGDGFSAVPKGQPAPVSVKGIGFFGSRPPVHGQG